MTQTPSQDAREYRKTATIRASQWLKNGDHPSDYANAVDGLEDGEMRSWTGDEAKALGWEGQIVRYYRHPDDSGERLCEKCGGRMHDHGWIDTLEGGHIVCPGDWIATGVKGEHWPIKPDVFGASYVPVEAHLRSTSPAGEVGEIAQRIVREFRPEGWPAKEAEVARLIDRHFAERLAASDTEAMRQARDAMNAAVAHRYGDWVDILRRAAARIDAALAKGGAT